VDFSAITVREDYKEFKMYREGKGIRKKRHQMFKLLNLCGNQLITHYLLLSLFLPSAVWGSFQQLNFE
jgi:hypothetical protein